MYFVFFLLIDYEVISRLCFILILYFNFLFRSNLKMIGGELKPVPKSKKYGYVESTLDTGNSVNKVQKMQQEKNYGTSFQV